MRHENLFQCIIGLLTQTRRFIGEVFVAKVLHKFYFVNKKNSERIGSGNSFGDGLVD